MHAWHHSIVTSRMMFGTVDGKNPSPLDMANIPSVTGFWKSSNWWFQPTFLKLLISSNWIISAGTGENKGYFKPPPRNSDSFIENSFWGVISSLKPFPALILLMEETRLTSWLNIPLSTRFLTSQVVQGVLPPTVENILLMVTKYKKNDLKLFGFWTTSPKICRISLPWTCYKLCFS